MKKSKCQSQYYLFFQSLYLLYPFLDVFIKQLSNVSGAPFVEKKCLDYLATYYMKLGTQNGLLKKYPNGYYYTTDLDTLLLDGHYAEIGTSAPEHNNGYWLSVQELDRSSDTEMEETATESERTPLTTPNTETPLSVESPQMGAEGTTPPPSAPSIASSPPSSLPPPEREGAALENEIVAVNVSCSILFDCLLDPPNPSNPQNVSTPVNPVSIAQSSTCDNCTFSDLISLPSGSQYALFRLRSIVSWRCPNCGARNSRGCICISCSYSLSKKEVASHCVSDM